ncbi:MAG: hypothetical protein DMG31_15385 [Acidobacteria bacterium]|nr:MAG: hypothetical protein DMG31_15385 [Acidobacteriota bacterium]
MPSHLHFRTQKEDVMNGMPTTLALLLISWGTITAVLLVLVIYGNTLTVKVDPALGRREQTASSIDSGKPTAVSHD